MDVSLDCSPTNHILAMVTQVIESSHFEAALEASLLHDHRGNGVQYINIGIVSHFE